MPRWFALVVVSSLGGCDADPVAEERVAEGAGWGDEDAARVPAVYYEVFHDDRRCAWPQCGGYWFVRLNHPDTVCLDGSVADMCYLTEMNLGGLGLDEAATARADEALGQGRLIVRGRMRHKLYGSFDGGRFAATEAWAGDSGAAPSGRFVRVEDDGVTCFTDPCIHLTEQRLNRGTTAGIADLDFSTSGASAAEITDALLATLSEDGVIVAGERITVSGPAGTAPARSVTAHYLRLRPALP
jgi:hypothetical protein